MVVSTLGHIYHNKSTNQPQLLMNEIAGFEAFNSFADLRNYVIGLQYPNEQASKLECFGWVPTLFMPSDRVYRRPDGTEVTKHGNWRVGAEEADRLSIFYADVDNAAPGQPIVTMEHVAARLDAFDGPLSYFMYSSFSHAAAKPKFRVVVETSRDISRSEMLRLALYLNCTAFGGQADLSIYDPGDFIFAPPHQTVTLTQLEGAALDVDATLAKQALLAASNPNSVAAYLQARQPRAPSKPITKKRRASMKAKATDTAAARLLRDHTVGEIELRGWRWIARQILPDRDGRLPWKAT